MGELEDLSVFAKIVEAGSVSKAAAALNLAKSAVSRRLSLLEDRFGLSLIDRRPGIWALTERGQQLYSRAASLLIEMEAIKAELRNERLALSGPLSISLPRDIGLGSLARLLPEFSKAYPDIQLSLQFDNRQVDLRHESFDAALRITAEKPDGVKAEYLSTFSVHVVASPAYLAKTHPLKQPNDLVNHRFLAYGNALTSHIPFEAGAVSLRAVSCSNSGIYLRDAAIAGQGLVSLPSFLCEREIRDGRLKPILQAYRLPSLKAYLCTPIDAAPNRRAQVFSKFLKQLMVQED